MPYDSIYRPGLFSGQTVIITGGGTGIGRCTAHELAALGARVALVGRRIEKLDATVREIQREGGDASAHMCDIREEARVQAVIDSVLDRNGRIDALVNNAGGQYIAPIRDLRTKGWEAVIRNNLTGGFIFSREVYLRWMEKNGGVIVNMIADIAGGWPLAAHSGAARAGMLNFTQSAAAEWAHSGVRVNAVGPGGIDGSGMATYTDEEKRPFLNAHKRVPLQRRGTEAEVSSAIVFLLSPGATYITGSLISVDGGAPTARRLQELPHHTKSKPYEGLHLVADDRQV